MKAKDLKAGDEILCPSQGLWRKLESVAKEGIGVTLWYETSGDGCLAVQVPEEREIQKR